MIQLKNKKKILLIGGLVMLVFIFFFFWRLVINKNNSQIVPPTTNLSNTLPVRIMTDKEKAKVNLEASQQAEVVNDQNGLYVYKLK